MRPICLILSLSCVLSLGGCWGSGRQEVSAGHYVVTGYLLDADDRTLDRESREACPNGYSVVKETHGMVAEGAAWDREIRCNTSN